MIPLKGEHVYAVNVLVHSDFMYLSCEDVEGETIPTATVLTILTKTYQQKPSIKLHNNRDREEITCLLKP